MSPAHLALRRAEVRLLERLELLERRLDQGDDGVWRDYSGATAALAAISRQTATAPDGHLLSSRELAQRLGISVRTLLRKKATGEIAPALVLGRRGRASVRWAAP